MLYVYKDKKNEFMIRALRSKALNTFTDAKLFRVLIVKT